MSNDPPEVPAEPDPDVELTDEDFGDRENDDERD